MMKLRKKIEVLFAILINTTLIQILAIGTADTRAVEVQEVLEVQPGTQLW